jgi:hypothetical protein
MLAPFRTIHFAISSFDVQFLKVCLRVVGPFNLLLLLLLLLVTIKILIIYLLGNIHLSQTIGGIKLSQRKEIHSIP